jgi:hypothetical protein
VDALDDARGGRVRPAVHPLERSAPPRSDDWVQWVPIRWASVHAAVRTYRNTTVAHSQSDLASPLPVALLKDDGAVGRVMGITASHPMPRVLAVQLRSRVGAEAEEAIEEGRQLVDDALLGGAVAVARGEAGYRW